MISKLGTTDAIETELTRLVLGQPIYPSFISQHTLFSLLYVCSIADRKNDPSTIILLLREENSDKLLLVGIPESTGMEKTTVTFEIVKSLEGEKVRIIPIEGGYRVVQEKILPPSILPEPGRDTIKTPVTA